MDILGFDGYPKPMVEISLVLFVLGCVSNSTFGRPLIHLDIRLEIVER